jgi:adenylate cyclase
VLLKFITKSIRSLGLFIIFFFAIFCIFGSLFMRDIDDNSLLSKFLEYTGSFESRFFDYRMRNQLDPQKKSTEVALVKIDDYSLEKIGVWPIPRSIHAQMIDKLKVYGAKVVALDVLYPEKAPVCGPSSPDTVLAESFKNFQADGGRVFLSYTIGTSEEDSLKEAPVEMLNDTVVTQSSSDVNMHPYRIGRYTFPIEEFVASEVGMGSISSNDDPDGVFRQYLLVLNVDTIYFGSLGFNAWEAFTNKKHDVKIFNDGTGELAVDGQKLEITNRGETKIRFLGGLENFSNVSLYDVLNAKDDDAKMLEALKGKIVFVGSTALGAHDLRSAPIDSKMPGVLAHMNITHMLLNKFFYKPTNESVKYSLYLLCLGMILFLIIQRLGSASLDLLMTILILAGAYAADYYYFLPAGYELRLFYCFFCFIASYSWNTFLKFSEASKEKKQIKGTFARYVAPTIVDEMLKDPDKLHVGGFKRDITCLFSDVRDFTAISEGLSATELAHSLNMYMGRMTDVVFDTKGTLDKYIGDAIVAFWGAPLEIGNHAQYAVEGAITMMNILPEINAKFRELGRPEFKVGIGLNSGECNVGNMGSDRIFSYTALGDNMNLGARLESLCKHYGAHILISEYTLKRIDVTNIKYRPIDKVIVKGKTKPVEIFEVLHGWHPMTLDPEGLIYYVSAWDHFQKRYFLEAKNICDQLLMGLEDDKPTKRLRDLCEKYLQHPELADDKFDVTKMTEK